MSLRIIVRTAVLAAALVPATRALAEPITVDEFRRELVGMPLCGTPTTGPLAGKGLCAVHLPDGTAVLAGAGLIVRGVWEVDGGHICRREAHEPVERRHCVDYERIGKARYRNSDGVEVCIGPCPPSEPASEGMASPGGTDAGNTPPAPAAGAASPGGTNSAGTNPGTK
ncbi:MAG TPA: hypothetical protein VGX95_01265 [Xanthobacteraceae bacterium]|jgi:hypothetical protein|nr:hypothetical protein [Xanthobacteraceae bacterium]